MLDTDIDQKVKTIRKGLFEGTSTQAAANALFELDLELRAARAFIRSVKEQLTAISKP